MDGDEKTPVFKVGDRVTCVEADDTDGRLVKGQTYEIEFVYGGGGLVRVHNYGWLARRFTLAAPATADSPRVEFKVNNSDGATIRIAKAVGLLAEPATADTALRYNATKPESDYILTYEGGIRAAFKLDFAYYDTLQALACLYRDQGGFSEVLDALRRETHVRSESIVQLIADTCERGSRKYARGNYLRGGNWRQYFQAAVRHAERIQAGHEHDAEGFSHRGNFIWNVLMACHSISTGLGTDDRIRPCNLNSTPTKI